MTKLIIACVDSEAMGPTKMKPEYLSAKTANFRELLVKRSQLTISKG